MAQYSLLKKYQIERSRASLRKIVRKVGGAYALAKLLGASSAQIYSWLVGHQRGGKKCHPPISSTHVKRLVEISEGTVTASDLRPDIF